MNTPRTDKIIKNFILCYGVGIVVFANGDIFKLPVVHLINNDTLQIKGLVVMAYGGSSYELVFDNKILKWRYLRDNVVKQQSYREISITKLK